MPQGALSNFEAQLAVTIKNPLTGNQKAPLHTLLQDFHHPCSNISWLVHTNWCNSTNLRPCTREASKNSVLDKEMVRETIRPWPNGLPSFCCGQQKVIMLEPLP